LYTRVWLLCLHTRKEAEEKYRRKGRAYVNVLLGYW